LFLGQAEQTPFARQHTKCVRDADNGLSAAKTEIAPWAHHLREV